MKLTTKKLKFTRSLTKPVIKLFVVFFLLIFFNHTATSQQLQFNYDNIPLSKALVDISKKRDIRISFDAGQLEKIRITKSISGTNTSELLSEILEGTNYIFETRFNTYLIIKKANITNPKVQKERTFSGIVFDKETGERLPYASILLLEKNVSVSTTVDGTFSIRLADSSRSFLQIKYIGYYTLDTLIYSGNQDRYLSFGLLKRTQDIPTVDVTGDKLEMVNFNDEAGHLTFNPAKFSDLPNYGETDVFRALQLLPGISSSENSSQLHIRGSSADQNLVMFDGFTLYNLDHFFGTFSALNHNVIKNIQVYRGGFDSRYGERVSGIIDITGKSGNQQKPTFYGGINLISGNLTAEIPVTKKLTLVAAWRRAYSDIYSSWFADALLFDKFGQNRRIPVRGANVITPKFYFNDYNLKLTYHINQQENISFSLYGAKDDLNSSNIIPDTLNIKDVNKWGNYGFGVSWKKQWNANYFTNFQIGHSGYFNDYNNKAFSVRYNPMVNQVDTINEITNESNDLTDYFAALKNNYFLNKSNELEFGFSAKYNRYTYFKDASRDSQEFIYSNLENSALLFSVFFQDKISVGNKFSLKPGLRTNYYGKTGKIYFEPRFASSYKAGSGVTLKMATGRYYQYLNKSATEQSFGYNRDFWVLSDNVMNPIVSSNHLILGGSYETRNLFFDIEGYYKTVKGLQEYLFFQNPGQREDPNPGNADDPDLSRFISGDGKAIGIDILAKYENNHFTSWLAYSISKATRTFAEINNGKGIPALYDQKHEIKWTNIYTYNRWNFSTVTLFTTGHPYIVSSTKDDDFNTTRVYSRLPDYFRLDFSVNYNFNVKNINIKPGLSILNALNTENYLDIYTRGFDFPNEQVNETTLIKAQPITLNFFVNFRF